MGVAMPGQSTTPTDLEALSHIQPGAKITIRDAGPRHDGNYLVLWRGPYGLNIEPLPPVQTRIEKMQALVEQWAEVVEGHHVGCLELHFSEQQVKAVLKVSLGQKKL